MKVNRPRLSALFAFLFSGCVSALLSGCVSAIGSRAHSEETVAFGSCNPNPCAKVTIETLPDLPPTFTEEARANVLRKVDEVLYAPLDEGSGEPSRKTFLASVEAQYDDYMREKDPTMVVDWTIERVASLLYSNGEIASVAISSRGFLGGAHGFDERRLFVFDAKTGRALTWDDVVEAQSRPVFLKVAEAEFKRSRDISPERSLIDAGFTFEGDGSFGLPLNFAVTEKGVVCHYNPYEVGPYVMGATDFTVPMDAVKPALTSQAVSLFGVTESNKGLL